MVTGNHSVDWRRVMAPQGSASALVRVGSDPAQVARHCSGIAYVAAPYDAHAGQRRKWQIDRSTMMSTLAAREVLRLICARVSAICPTVLRAEAMHAAPTVKEAAVNPLDLDFWANWSAPYLNACGIIVVPDIRGWQRCPMVARDVTWALDHNVPVHIYAGAA
jgi:hypothetical protein